MSDVEVGSVGIPSELGPGTILGPDKYIASPDGGYILKMQADGNLVLRAPSDNKVVWASGSDSNPRSALHMQSDGNLVVRAPGNVPVWASGTDGNPGTVLQLQNEGNAVLYAPGHRAIWSTPLPAPPPAPSELGAGKILGPDRYLRSPDGRYILKMQADGNLVLRSSAGPRWATGTDGNPGSALHMQSDGNLVVRAPGNVPVWASGTDGNPGTVLQLQSDGNAVLYAPGHRAIWDTNGGRVPPPAPPVVPSELGAGKILGPDKYLRSPDGRYILKMQADGNLVLRSSAGPHWASGTDGHPGTTLHMQSDGNLVLRAPGNRPIWSSRTDGNPGTVLQLQNDGKAVLYAPGHRAIWIAPPPPPPAGGGNPSEPTAPPIPGDPSGLPDWPQAPGPTGPSPNTPQGPCLPILCAPPIRGRMNIPGADLQYEIKFDNDFQGRARLTLSDTKADGYCVYARVAYNLQLWNDREVDLPVVCGVGKYYLATSRHTHPGAPFGLKIVSVRLYLCLQRFGNRVGCTREEFINNMLCGTCNDKRLSERPPMALDERIKDLARMEL